MSAALAAVELALVPGVDAQSLERLAGRLHPLLVHFPIAFLIAAAFVESWAALRRRRQKSPSAAFCLVLGLVASLAAAGSGWLLAAHESPGGGERLELHRWSGVGTVILAATAWVLGLACRRSPERVILRIYRISLLLAALLGGVTAHVGATLVWGSDWLFEPLRDAPTPASLPLADARAVQPALGSPALDPLAEGPSAQESSLEATAFDFSARVWPILESRCIECHGSERPKGRLRLDGREHVLGPLARRAVVVPGDPAASELLRRVSLPADDPDAMPPEGERLTSAQLESLREWIVQGAPWPAGTPSAQSARNASPAPAASGPRPQPEPSSGPSEEDPQEVLRALGARVGAIARGEPELDIGLARVATVDLPRARAALLELGPRVRWLDLSGTDTADADLAGFERFERLERLRLDRTRVGDGALALLARLPSLRILNLVGTGVGDAGLAQLAAAPQLERVYTFESAVSEEGLRALAAARPGLTVIGAQGAQRVAPEGGAGPRAETPAGEGSAPVALATSGPELAAAATALLASNCHTCHGPDRVRGKLRLDGRERALAGPRPVIVPGDPGASELLRRVSLPPDDVDVMPPDPPHLGEHERELLARWIAAGAPWPTEGPTEGPTAGPTAGTAQAPLDPTASAGERVDELPEPDEGALRALRERGALAQRIALDERAVEVSLRVLGPAAGDAELALLRGLEPNLVWLDLSGTSITDAGLAGLAGFTRLERLGLGRTSIGEAGLRALRLPRLASLNLFDTAVGDGALETLASFPALVRVFLAQSQVSAAGAQALRERRPTLEVVGSP